MFLVINTGLGCVYIQRLGYVPDQYEYFNIVCTAIETHQRQTVDTDQTSIHAMSEFDLTWIYVFNFKFL